MQILHQLMPNINFILQMRMALFDRKNRFRSKRVFLFQQLFIKAILKIRTMNLIYYSYQGILYTEAKKSTRLFLKAPGLETGADRKYLEG